jgi:hypothetical protein
MPATARLIVLMEPQEKASLDAEAAAARVSTAEFVRRRLTGRISPDEQLLLELLIGLEPQMLAACQAIDANLSDIRASRSGAEARDAEVARRARLALGRSELAAVADHLALSPPAVRRRRGRA